MKYNQKKYHLKNCERLLERGLSRNEISEVLITKSARNKQYWIERGFSNEESIKMARSKMPGTIEYYEIYLGMTKENAIQEVKKYQSKRCITLENFIKKYGKKEGKLKFKLYCDKQSYSNTLEYMVKKYGVDKGTKKYYTANKNRAITLNNLIKKHGKENGEKIYNEYVKKQRVNGKTKEYFIEKYGLEKGKKIYKELGRKKSMTYEGFLTRNNGDVEKSTKEFEEYCKKRYYGNILSGGVSKSSQNFFEKLHMELKKLDIDGIYYASFNQEWGINIIGKRYVYLDFFVKSKGKVIEFYGDYYHANPKKYNKNDIIKHYGTEKKVEIIWKEDYTRIEDIKSVPYILDVKIIWSSDIENDENKVIQECVQYLIQ